MDTPHWQSCTAEALGLLRQIYRETEGHAMLSPETADQLEQFLFTWGPTFFPQRATRCHDVSVPLPPVWRMTLRRWVGWWRYFAKEWKREHCA